LLQVAAAVVVLLVAVAGPVACSLDQPLFHLQLKILLSELEVDLLKKALTVPHLVSWLKVAVVVQDSPSLQLLVVLVVALVVKTAF
jgi:hypothetical protein